MAGYIEEFFGRRVQGNCRYAREDALKEYCPFIKARCRKILPRQGIRSGVCAVRQKTPNSPCVICCPTRLYADDYSLLRQIAVDAFHQDLKLYPSQEAVDRAKCEGGAIAVFGHGWGRELRLPQRNTMGSYYVDWVLALLGTNGELLEITAVEVQTIDTTGSYAAARKSLIEQQEQISDTVGLNWENVSKRIIPQIIYKGQVLQREDLCRNGLYFVAPLPVYERVLKRLGGKAALPSFPSQPAAIHFIAYDYVYNDSRTAEEEKLGIIERHTTTVFKIQEAFPSLTLPEGNVYRAAIEKSLYNGATTSE